MTALVMEGDFDFVCSKIESEKEYLNSISQEIWRTPELKFKEVHAHTILTNALYRYGFEVQKHYILDTAFRAEYVSKTGSGPTVAILLEYDALPEIGHACGHNLISEAGLAAAVAIKATIDRDTTLGGKLVVLGTPAEESGGGKIRLIEKGAFDGVDIALMVHPTNTSSAFPPTLCIIRGSVVYKGKEAHAGAFPWEGRNALDAAVACYNGLSLFRQQLRPTHRIHAIITEGGTAANIIPARAKLELSLRTPKLGELNLLKSRVEDIIKGAACSTSCDVEYTFDESDVHQNVITNKILGNLYKGYFEKLGKHFDEKLFQPNAGSTDMGNVSHLVPSIHPFFAIPTKGVNHTKEFTEAAGASTAQNDTLTAAKAMALTALTSMRSPDILKNIKEHFQAEIAEDLKV